MKLLKFLIKNEFYLTNPGKAILSSIFATQLRYSNLEIQLVSLKNWTDLKYFLRTCTEGLLEPQSSTKDNFSNSVGLSDFSAYLCESS